MSPPNAGHRRVRMTSPFDYTRAFLTNHVAACLLDLASVWPRSPIHDNKSRRSRAAAIPSAVLRRSLPRCIGGGAWRAGRHGLLQLWGLTNLSKRWRPWRRASDHDRIPSKRGRHTDDRRGIAAGDYRKRRSRADIGNGFPGREDRSGFVHGPLGNLHAPDLHYHELLEPAVRLPVPWLRVRFGRPGRRGPAGVALHQFPTQFASNVLTITG